MLKLDELAWRIRGALYQCGLRVCRTSTDGDLCCFLKAVQTGAPS